VGGSAEVVSTVGGSAEVVSTVGGSAEVVSTVGGSAEVGSAAEHSAVEDLAAMDMDAATMVTGADMDMGSATTVVTEATAGMLAIPSIPTTSVAIIRTSDVAGYSRLMSGLLLIQVHIGQHLYPVLV
jgi:hypothetical protein